MTETKLDFDWETALIGDIPKLEPERRNAINIGMLLGKIKQLCQAVDSINNRLEKLEQVYLLDYEAIRKDIKIIADNINKE